MSEDDLNERFGIDGMVRIQEGRGGLTRVAVSTTLCEAEVYLHGAHVTHFQRKNDRPLLFMSRDSRFELGKAIRGGIPVIFPWFGDRDGQPAHGFARVTEWELTEVLALPDETIRTRFVMPKTSLSGEFEGVQCEYIVKFGRELEAELNVWDESKEHAIEFESCLHSYFAVGNIETASVRGLQHLNYLDKLQGFAEVFERNEAVRFDGEVDRIYLDTSADTQIVDETWKRIINVRKRGSASTVVWNPWIDKSKRLNDLGDQDYREFVCVESCNVNRNSIRLAPGQTATLHIALSSDPL